MSLVSPGHIRGGDEKHGNTPMSRRRYQLVQCPVFKDETDQEHENAQSPKDCDGRNFAILAVTNPQPAQEEHRKAVDGP